MMTMREKAEKMVEETLDLLRNKPVNSTLTERWFLLEEAWEEVRDLPQPLQQGYGLAYILDRASLPIKEQDLLVGRFVEKIPDEEEEARFQAMWKDGAPYHNPISRFNIGHTTLDMAHLVEWGIGGFLSRCEERIAREKAEGGEEKVLLFLAGMREVYRACGRYIARYGKAARDAGREDLAETCESIAFGAPKNFREGLQLLLLVVNIYQLYAGQTNTTLCYRRVDQMLYPLYKADLTAGRMTREEAGYLIDDFNCKICLPLGRGEHQMADASGSGVTTGFRRNPVYDDPLYVMLGGRVGEQGEENGDNPLTELFLEHIRPRFENPVYLFRRSSMTSPSLHRLVCDKLREGSSLLVYNDDTMISAMMHAGVAPTDAVNYTIHACNWPDLPSYAVVDTIGGPIPRMILHTLMDGDRLRRDYPTLDDLYDAVGEDFRAMVKERFAAYRARYRSGTPLPPSGRLSMTDCFTEGVIDAARGVFDGGVRYPAVYTLLRNIGTAADMMAALEEIVYRRGACTLAEMVAALSDNFEKEPALRTLALKSPKYGRDEDAADRHAARLMNLLLDILDEEAVNEKGERDVISLNVTITDMFHIREGAKLCATPDGRACGAPLSENLSPTVGVVESVTALLNSVAKLPFDRIHSGAFNLRLRQDAVEGEEGLDRLCALLDAYFTSGGMQVQLSVADTATLRAAQAHPEDYKDLMVRITGYSAVFVDMTKNAQEEIIRRDEMGA